MCCDWKVINYAVLKVTPPDYTILGPYLVIWQSSGFGIIWDFWLIHFVTDMDSAQDNGPLINPHPPAQSSRCGARLKKHSDS